MMIVIGNALDTHETAALREAAEKLEYEDGKRTAGRYARNVKSNLQAVASPGLETIFTKVRDTLNGNEVFRSAARPKKFARLLLSRYRGGMTYGTHVDDPVMMGSRTDLSFTLALSDPGEYDGGELVMEDAVEERGVRLAAGDLVLYPTSALHRVEPVTRGERMAIVGWVTSWVRDPARREILFDLDAAAKAIFDEQGKSPAFDRVFKAKANLSRMWYDD
ncbi:MAG: Fe2+-dependent dioxygenase [Paracoccus sp. (in: a-proteobacteria)]|jgi:PKHD-type hydroxylase|uniref:Fe2+-dependent dioxygenase n=2 Tax=Paracoccus TaxID=265 RepID=UPI000C4BF4C7|nr:MULTISPECIES: Fe2+-dependent dioxygenase [unclassified Paracoccus (in: a-proteobacteria)]MAN57684.1 Fe2+-dependent dioxygenase [Paracoccus sp. (in: a-proteobacteria)]MBA48643.1 Fe2+-dependent dioxygenase [Paracoccus sp. (in: a-proteobacteria)]MCS5603834.1 Fe2+-dependent dioxygenase [Paracoccus sp. (in: a-proteobacteria)]MDB2552525.1 Fe2+-dependent dioxygenase [Paracoccus sp. (in: a-proteobacteria)]HIC64742.1 Fe2+-dependent dioxygenase [Paracoccus sp. (in: a-proteobacteria)]|tara:strand:- start:1514 stop:2173 length:660 start_codon:yes stop_codon:yes gene_type:complete